MSRFQGLIFLAVVLAISSGCASQASKPVYPSFLQLEDIPESFLAELPGTRARIMTANVESRSYSMLLQIPPDYDFGTGGAPDKSLEIYVLEGSLQLGEFTLDAGGYAYLPAAHRGARMRSDSGAVVLYFIDNRDDTAVIETPIIGDSDLLPWTPVSGSVEDFGLAVKELRADPGSGARTWLIKIEPGAVQSWQSSSATREGYLMQGEYLHSECSDGVPYTGEYLPGGFFKRPPDAVNGGPESAAVTTSIWFMRVSTHAVVTRDLYCGLGE